MSKKFYWMLVATFLATQMVFTVGCDEADDTDVEEQDTTPEEQDTAVTEVEVDMLGDVMGTLVDYVDNMEYPPAVGVSTVWDEVVVGGDDSYQLVDVRPAGQFAGGHVEGAINLPYGAGWELAETLEQLDMDKKIVLICNTGHKASFLTLYLIQLGYEAYAMKFGMMGWNSDLTINGISASYCSVGGAQDYLTDAATVATETFDAPEIMSSVTVEELTMELAGDYWAAAASPVIKAVDVNDQIVVGGSEDYQIVDIRFDVHYAAAHIPGAINAFYSTFLDDSALENLDPSKKLVVVCYTGHTASQITMLLNELGYEAYAMAYGMMGWHSDPAIVGTDKVIDCDAVPDYAVVTPTP